MAGAAVAAQPLEPTGAAAPSALRSLVVPPAGLLQRVRWFFVLAALAFALAYGAAGTVASATAGRLWPLTLVASLWLAAIWIYGYRRRFTLLTDLLSAAGIVALGASVPEPRFVFAVNACIWVRALSGTPRQTAAATVIYLVAYFEAVWLAWSAQGTSFSLFIVSRTIVAVLFAVSLSLVAGVVATYERSIARERRLRAAGRALAEARDRPALYAAALSGARELLTGTAEYGVELAVGTETHLNVAAAAGEGAAGADGAALQLRDLPEPLRAALHQGTAFEVQHAEPDLWRALDFSPRTGQGTIYGLPLVAHGRFEGALVVGSHDPLDDELKDDFQTLGDLVALALESQFLLEARGGPAAATVPVAATAAVVKGEPGSTDAPERPSPFDRARAALGTATAAAVRPAGTTAPLWRPPHDLPARVRWYFLVFTGAMTLWVGVYSLVSLVRGPFAITQLVAALIPLWLGGWFVYGYRRGGFPWIGDVVVSALLVPVLLSTPAFTLVAPAVIASVWFRSVYGGWRRLVLVVLLHIAALFVAAALSPDSGAGVSLRGSALLLIPIYLAVIAAAVHLFSVTLNKFERALARERTLRVAGAHLVAATDRGHVYTAALDGAQGLLAGTPGASAVVAVGSFVSTGAIGSNPVTTSDASPVIGNADDLAAVAAAGPHAAHATGRTIHVRDLAAALSEALHKGEPVDQPRAEPAVWQALDLEGQPGALYALPFHARGTLEGAIVIGSDLPLDAELKDDLQTLADLAALAVEDVALAESPTQG